MVIAGGATGVGAASAERFAEEGAPVVRAVLPHSLRQGGEVIGNTSSVAWVGEPERPAYAASKAGIEALTRNTSSRWGFGAWHRPGTKATAGQVSTAHLQVTRSPWRGESADPGTTFPLLHPPRGDVAL
ncbi:SDR family NAD(P)-dependent oxidoreductase [Streptomyces sp. NPDC090499]|uniref:SDR family NAD(P)-dependent oxidoreductase n=1 Tax=Streptomyces sp. NPDC090499 TaxID=3365965 RepID=UPI0037F544EB